MIAANFCFSALRRLQKSISHIQKYTPQFNQMIWGRSKRYTLTISAARAATTRTTIPDSFIFSDGLRQTVMVHECDKRLAARPIYTPADNAEIRTKLNPLHVFYENVFLMRDFIRKLPRLARKFVEIAGNFVNGDAIGRKT